MKVGYAGSNFPEHGMFDLAVLLALLLTALFLTASSFIYVQTRMHDL